MKIIEVKLYPKPAQEQTLTEWMRVCCDIYNRALDQRVKSYKRRKQSINYYYQSKLLTGWRLRENKIDAVPVCFERDALRRVDHGMKMFFLRLKREQRPGFPRYRSYSHYRSIEYTHSGQYVREDGFLLIPKLGLVRYRGQNQQINKTQKLLRIIHRANGWFAQVWVDHVKFIQIKDNKGPVGIDMGLSSFATFSNEDKIPNPRFQRKSEQKLRFFQRRTARRIRHSNRREKADKAYQRHFQKVKDQRKSFCHEQSTKIVQNYSFIAVEKLNVAKLKRTRLSKSIMDAGWGIFLNQLVYKAESAGRKLIQVNPAYTSQTCPNCGKIKKKKLSERVHACDCGCVLDRDVAAAMVILSRALDGNRGITGVEEGTNTCQSMTGKQVCPEKRLDS